MDDKRGSATECHVPQEHSLLHYESQVYLSNYHLPQSP